MGKNCYKCSWDGNEPEWEFCGHCGAELTGEPPQLVAKGDGDISETLTEVSTEQVKAKAKAKATATARPVSAPPARAKLVVMRGGQPEREFSITGESATIGRWDSDAGAFPEVDLSEDDPGCYVSRHHARIFVKEGRYFIEDLGSSNKTVVNKAVKLNPHSPHELKNGDEIIAGKTFLKFIIEY
jgi:hypothetical protein